MLGFNVHTNSTNDEQLVTNQVPKPGISLEEDSLICLYTEENEASVSVTVPNLKGMTASQARNSLRSKNLNISIEGSGKVISQSIAFDTPVDIGTVVTVTLQQEITDTH